MRQHLGFVAARHLPESSALLVAGARAAASLGGQPLPARNPVRTLAAAAPSAVRPSGRPLRADRPLWPQAPPPRRHALSRVLLAARTWFGKEGENLNVFRRKAIHADQSGSHAGHVLAKNAEVH